MYSAVSSNAVGCASVPNERERSGQRWSDVAVQALHLPERLLAQRLRDVRAPTQRLIPPFTRPLLYSAFFFSSISMSFSYQLLSLTL